MTSGKLLHPANLLVLALAAFAVAALALAPRPAQTLETFERSELTIVTDTGRHRFSVELATNGKQRAQGLMYRRTLPADHGMLFDYRLPQNVSMWMKNTYIPLDMLFIDADGTVKNLHERAVPGSMETISSSGKVRGPGTERRDGAAPGHQARRPGGTPAVQALGGVVSRSQPHASRRAAPQHEGSNKSRMPTTASP